MAKKEKEENQIVSIEQVLTQIGEFGLYQKLVDAVFCVVFLFVAFQILIMYFTTLTPASWVCNNSSTACTSLFNGTQPSKPSDPAKVKQIKARCSLPPNSWKYTEASYFSLVTQFNICDDEEWLLELLQSIHFIGWGVGGIVLGLAGDVFGRKNLLFPSSGVVLLCGFITAFMKNIYVILALRFVIGFFLPGAMVQANILISEIVGNKKRPLAAMIPFFSFPIGYSILAVKSYLLQNWKHLSLVCTAPYAFVFAFYFFVTKSPKWLLTRGRCDEALQSLQKIAQWNKTKLNDNIILSRETGPADTSNSNKENTGAWNRSVIVAILLQSYIWLVVTMSFFGLQMAAKELQGSMYSNFILLSMVQFPAIIATIFACNKFGRKKTNLISLVFASAACLGIVFIPKKFPIPRVVLGIVGKFFASITFQALYLWSAELFPTTLRSKAMGILQIAARVGATGAPWVVKGLSPLGGYLPFVVLGVPSFIGSILGIWLKETKVSKSEESTSTAEVDQKNDSEL